MGISELRYIQLKQRGMFVLSHKQTYGESFDLLRTHFDCKLVMGNSMEELAGACRWKLEAILRTRRFNTGIKVVCLYKTHLLSFIEYRTAAIYHVCDTAPALLDDVQNKVLNAAGITNLETLNNHKLAPLSPRRDIAMLGPIHRTVLGRRLVHVRRSVSKLMCMREGREWANTVCSCCRCRIITEIFRYLVQARHHTFRTQRMDW